ncbi:MAG TPA: LacI family DNA-binding transcriptional regulator [Arachnia sp.]|nr:LacI family DNA-binding transcriptional regulator [Arachnia sp.]HMT87799.1 LacI family DNA-binding transcriptional regulator [Arachnia sp.]
MTGASDDAESRSVTIYDIAAAAGVATSTVSRTFTRPGRVSAKTAAKVRAVAEELGYKSSPRPVTADHPATRLLAMMVADIANPFYATLVRGAQLTAAEAGYEIVLLDTRESGRRERTALDRILPVVDGVAVASSRMPDNALRTIAKQIPLVVINRELRGTVSVLSDNVGGTQSAIRHLRAAGHESVTYVGGPEASWNDGVRSRAVRDFAQSLGMRTTRIGPFLPTIEGGWTAGTQLAEQPPSAVIAFNDLMAIGIVQGLKANRVEVPRDVSVIGYDDIPAGRLCTPALTTIAIPARTLGSTAVTNLVALIRGARPGGEGNLVLSTKLIVRQSTGRVRPLF